MSIDNLKPEPIVLEVWSLIYTHRHGYYLYVLPSKRRAYEMMVELCNEWIDEFVQDDLEESVQEHKELKEILKDASRWEGELADAWASYSNEPECFDIECHYVNMDER